MMRISKKVLATILLSVAIVGCQLDDNSYESITGGHVISIDYGERVLDSLNVNVSNFGRKTYSEESVNSSNGKDKYWIDGRYYSILFDVVEVNPPFSIFPGTEESKKNRDWGEDIVKELNTYIKGHCFYSDVCPQFYNAGIKDGVSFYADKTLFGRDAGENLGDLLLLDIPKTSMLAATYPDFHLIKDYAGCPNSIRFSEFFEKGRALSLNYGFYAFFEKKPPEKYKEITFTIIIPIETEYMQQIIYGKDYPEEYYEKGLVERNENRVLRGSVTVRFEE